MGSTTVQAPAPRNAAAESADMLQAQMAAAPQQFANYAQYAPQYDQVDLARLTSLLGAPEGSNIFDLNRRLTDEAMQQSITSNRLQREADLRDASQLGGQANQISRANNAELYSSLDRLGAAAGSGVSPTVFELQAGNMASVGQPAYQAGAIGYDRVQAPAAVGNVSAFGVSGPNDVASVSANNVRGPGRVANVFAQGPDQFLMAAAQRAQGGPSAIQQTLESQALSELQQGGALSGAEQRAAINPIVNRFAATGLSRGNAVIANAATALDAAQRQRLNERRQFAAGVDAAGFSQGQSMGQLGLQASGAMQNYAQQGLAAQQANQQTGVALNQLGAQIGISNQDAALRAGLANQQSQLQGNQYRLQADLANQDAFLRAALANQNAQLQGNQMGLQAQLANQQAGLTAATTNEANRFAAAQYNGDAANRQFAQLMGLGAAQDARNQASFGQLATAAQGRLSTYQDPFLAILGRQSANIGTNAGLAGMGQGITAQNGANVYNQFNPFNAYGADLANTNYNGAFNANMATANNNAALIGAGIGALGMAAGGFLSRPPTPPCWVAREVYGINNPKWLEFRKWLLEDAPSWFRKLYIKHGERFAAWISNKPRIKTVIRRWMDTRIN